jgi:hypothetical protein
MNRKLLPVMFVALAGLAAADNRSDRANLIGKWESPEGGGSTWILQKSGDNLHITHSQKGETITDFECNTVARECVVNNAGHETKVSVWYNGPKLVVQEVAGSTVVRHRMHVADGDKMQVELISIVPDRKPEMATFVRSTESAAAHQ